MFARVLPCVLRYCYVLPCITMHTLAYWLNDPLGKALGTKLCFLRNLARLHGIAPAELCFEDRLRFCRKCDAASVWV